MKKIIKKPYSLKALRKMTKNGKYPYVKGIVSLELSDLYNGYESFLDVLSLKLTGYELLMDITYSVVGGKGDNIFVEVEGSVSEILNLL